MPPDVYLALAKAIEKIGLPDVLIFGRQAADLDQGTVGSIVAELLGLPSVTVLRSAERIERLLDATAVDPDPEV